MVTKSIPNSDQPPVKRLDASLVDSDGFLARSLNQEERGRRNRRRWLMATSCLLIASACGLALLVLAGPKLLASDKSAQGWKLWSQRRLPEAEAKFREALMENNKDADAWTGLGWSLTNTGRLKEAVDAFQKALEIKPDNVSAQNGLGQCTLGLGDLDMAEASLKKSHEGLVKLAGGEDKINVNSLPAAWYGLVNLYLLKDDFDQAKQWADRISKVKPGDDTLKGMLEQIQKRDSTPTKRMFGRDKPADAPKPADAATQANAWTLWQSGKYEQAIEQFQQLIKSQPKDANAHNGLGWCLLNSGKAKEAHEAFKQCLGIDAKHAGGLNGAGQSALALHDWAKAEEYLQKASDNYGVAEKDLDASNIPAAWFGLVNVHLVQGNYDKATEWAQKILKVHPDQADAKRALELAGKKDNSEIKKMLGVD